MSRAVGTLQRQRQWQRQAGNSRSENCTSQQKKSNQQRLISPAAAAAACPPSVLAAKKARKKQFSFLPESLVRREERRGNGMGLATSDQSRADRSDQFFIKCTAFFEWHHGETGKEEEEDEEGKGILGHHRTRQSVQVVLSFFLSLRARDPPAKRGKGKRSRLIG